MNINSLADLMIILVGVIVAMIAALIVAYFAGSVLAESER